MTLPVKPDPVDPHQNQIVECTRPVDLFNKDNPYSLAAVLTESFMAHVEKALKKRPDLGGLDERELYNKLHKEGTILTASDHRIRLNFWSEYQKASSTGLGLHEWKVAAGVCSVENLHHILKKAERTIWMICPPATYQTRLNEALHFATEKMREILELPTTDKKGKINTQLVALQAKIWDMLDKRQHGSIVQRSEQKILSVNVTDKQVNKMTVDESLAEVERKIKALEAKERKLARDAIEVKVNGDDAGTVIEVEARESTDS